MRKPNAKMGRPSVGECRLQMIVKQKVMDQLIAREKQGQGYRTRVAAAILEEQLIGGVTPKTTTEAGLLRHTF